MVFINKSLQLKLQQMMPLFKLYQVNYLYFLS